MTGNQCKGRRINPQEIFGVGKDGLKELLREVLQEVLEQEMTEALGAEKGERTAGRLGYRSGYYGRSLVTRVGKLELRIPQDRQGQFSTQIFERKTVARDPVTPDRRRPFAPGRCWTG